jgi:hypothetical protein
MVNPIRFTVWKKGDAMLRPTLRIALFLAMAVLPMGCASFNWQPHNAANEDFVIPWSEGQMSGYSNSNGAPMDYWSH